MSFYERIKFILNTTRLIYHGTSLSSVNRLELGSDGLYFRLKAVNSLIELDVLLRFDNGTRHHRCCADNRGKDSKDPDGCAHFTHLGGGTITRHTPSTKVLTIFSL